jgi:hypothetical protein
VPDEQSARSQLHSAEAISHVASLARGRPTHSTRLVVRIGAQRSGRGGGLNTNGGVGEGHGGVL